MLKKYSFLLALVWGIQLNLSGQTLPPLERGDMVPNELIRNVSNYVSDELRLSDFRGQWILIDFWGAGCIGCVGSFPMLDSMQRRYEGKLKILLVSQNNQEQLDKFVKSMRRKVVMPDVPHITSDTVLGQFFPYVAVPYHVWIDPEGRFYAGTSNANLTPHNIDRLLNGEQPYFKPSVYVPYSTFTAASVMEVATGIQPDVRSEYSFFTGYVPKGSSIGYESSYVDSTHRTMRRTFSNLGLSSLAQKAVRSSGNVSDSYAVRNRIFYDMSNREVLAMPEDDGLIEEWKAANLFSYEIQVSFDESDQLSERISHNILRYLKSYAGITVYEDKRKIKVVKVRLRDGGVGIKADTTRLEYQLFPAIQKTNLDLYFWRPIKGHYARQNVFFEKNFAEVDFPVDITVGEHWRDLDSLKAILAPQGIDLIEEEVEDMVLVISDRKNLRPQIGPIATGQRVPDDFWERKHVRYHNGNLDTIDFSAYKGKFLLLDFWNVNCGTCIQSFPAMKNLQAKYGDKLAVMAVNDRDPYEKVHTLYQGRLKDRGIDDVPSLIGDEYLSKLFHKAGYPHYIWIAPGGNVIMQTFSIHFMSDEAIEHLMSIEGFFPKGKE